MELQSLPSHGPIVKVELVKIVFCWLQPLHAQPTPTMHISRIPTSMFLRLMLNLSGIDPSAPTTTGTTFVLTPHILFLAQPP